MSTTLDAFDAWCIANDEPLTNDDGTIRSCACARYEDGSVSAFLCPQHADSDPCESKSRVTGRRRKGSIVRGVCSSCGWGS